MSKDHVVSGQFAEELGRGHRRCNDSSDVPRQHGQHEWTHGRSSIPDDNGENTILVFGSCRRRHDAAAVVVVVVPIACCFFDAAPAEPYHRRSNTEGYGADDPER